MRRRRPERCSSAGVWIAPPHTTTWAASIVPARPSGAWSAARTARPPSSDEPVDAVAGDASRAPAATARGRYVRVMLCRAPVAGVAAGRVGHPARDLARGASRARPRRGAAPRWPASGRRAPVCTSRSRSTSSQMAYELVGGRSPAIGVLGAPPVEHVLGRAAVQAAVDLGAAAGAAALGVGDRREAERDGDAAGAVLAVHLLERERHDLALARPRGPPRRRARRSPASASRRRSSPRRRRSRRRAPRPRGAATRSPGAPAVARSAACRATSPRCRRRPASARGGRTRRRSAAGAAPSGGDDPAVPARRPDAADDGGDGADADAHRRRQAVDAAGGELDDGSAALGRQVREVVGDDLLAEVGDQAAWRERRHRDPGG